MYQPSRCDRELYIYLYIYTLASDPAAAWARKFLSKGFVYFKQTLDDISLMQATDWERSRIEQHDYH